VADRSVAGVCAVRLAPNQSSNPQTVHDRAFTFGVSARKRRIGSLVPSGAWLECENYKAVRIVGLDLGERRIGVAISDATRTLARPVGVLQRPASDDDALRVVTDEIARLTAEDDGVESIVLGLPRRLDGTPNDMTPRVEAFARELRVASGLPVALQDERLSSREAESRLAVRERDWRARKKKIDAAAAAIILQDYLDAR
jgi:putative holliday junction resolvase